MNYQILGQDAEGNLVALPVVVIDRSNPDLTRLTVHLPPVNESRRREERRFSAAAPEPTGFGVPDGPL